MSKCFHKPQKSDPDTECKTGIMLIAKKKLHKQIITIIKIVCSKIYVLPCLLIVLVYFSFNSLFYRTCHYSELYFFFNSTNSKEHAVLVSGDNVMFNYHKTVNE